MYIGHLITFILKVFFFDTAPSSICVNNQNADPFIQGDTPNGVQNFLHVISDKGDFILTGDTALMPDGCRKANSQFKHRKGRHFNGSEWILDCWDPFECTMIEDRLGFKLIPKSASARAPVRVRTVLLPLDEHKTSSYTFLPQVTLHDVFFVTAMLTGCSFFVATPNNRNCNLIVIHSNYRCTDPSAIIDFNHLQAMAVLEEVQSTNNQCKYHIDRRWAEEDWRPVIEAGRYDYRERISYYNIYDGPSFLYGNYLGGYDGRWQICIKVAIRHSPPETCYYI